MADVKISALPSGSTLDGTEVVPIVQSSSTVKVTTQAIANLTSLASGATLFMNRQASNATGTIAFPANFTPAAGSTYSVGLSGFSWLNGVFDNLVKNNGVVLWDMNNNRIQSSSGSYTIDPDGQRLVSNNGADTFLTWSGQSILAFSKNLRPSADDSFDVGAATTRARALYGRQFFVSNGTNTTGSFALVSSSPGSNTINAAISAINATEAVGIVGISDSANNATQAGSCYIEAGNKGAGTGDGGDLFLRGGNTTGGSPGSIRISNDGSRLIVPKTITTAGTTGNQTIDKMSGTVNIAAAGTTVTVTCARCATTSIVFAVIRTNDATATIKNVVPGAGSFVITLTAGATAEVSIGFLVMN